MSDKLKILLGLVIFLMLLTFPVWYNAVNGKVEYKPELEFLTLELEGKDKCVMETEFMREKHMDLLNDWRQAVVREGKRVHTAPDGRKFNMSLSYTCMDCHSNKANFCDRCHNYLAVDPYCWECHLTPDDVNLKAMLFAPEVEEMEAVDMAEQESHDLNIEQEEGH
ncbi:sulfate reduction electron transfer complex DsrMKJOP subunit DsrJ [Calditrichota bacterium]